MCFRNNHYHTRVCATASVIMASIEKFLGVQYKLETSENFDEFMRELGVGFVTRKIGNAASPVVCLVKDGDKYILKTESTFKCLYMAFYVGETFSDETPDGRIVNSLVTFNGDTMTQTQDGEKKVEIIREFTEDEMTTTLTVGNIVSRRKYKRIN